MNEQHPIPELPMEQSFGETPKPVSPWGGRVGFLAVTLGLVVWFLILRPDPLDQPQRQRRTPRDYRVTLDQMDGFSEQCDQQLAAAGIGGCQVFATEYDGRLGYLELQVNRLMSKDEARYAGDIVGATFYRRYARHPTGVSIHVVQMPGKRNLAHVFVNRPD